MQLINDREYVNEVLGLNTVYRTIRAMLQADSGPVTAYMVARRIQENYGHRFDINPARLWRAVQAVADEELTAISRKPDNLAAALIGLDDNLR